MECQRVGSKIARYLLEWRHQIRRELSLEKDAPWCPQWLRVVWKSQPLYPIEMNKRRVGRGKTGLFTCFASPLYVMRAVRDPVMTAILRNITCHESWHLLLYSRHDCLEHSHKRVKYLWTHSSECSSSQRWKCEVKRRSLSLVVVCAVDYQVQRIINIWTNTGIPSSRLTMMNMDTTRPIIMRLDPLMWNTVRQVNRRAIVAFYEIIVDFLFVDCILMNFVKNFWSVF